TGVGAVLLQRQGQPPKTYPCAYFSHKLTPAERNYDVGNRELLAIKLALEEWRHWLEGAQHPFTLLTDHKNLEYLRSAKVLNHRQARWALFFTRFHFQAPTPTETILPTSVIVAPVSWDIMTKISEGHAQDPTPANCPGHLTYVPLDLCTRVLSHVHSTPSSGHPGIEATLHLLNNRFWWPSIRPDTITFIKNCSVCSTTKVPRQLPAGLLQPLPVPKRPCSHIAVDFITDLPSSHGNTTILTVVDRFSKGCHLIPLPKLPSTMEMAEALCNSVFRFYGLPEDIVSDRGPQFTSRLWTSFFRLLGVNCILGYQPPLFPWSGEPSELPAVNSWFQRSEETWNWTHVHLQRAVRRTRIQADRRRRPNPPYELGQWVWLSTRDLHLHLPCKKLSPRYVGPFKIIRQVTPVSFRLELPAEYRISPTFHVSLLKPAGDLGGVENLDEATPQGHPPRSSMARRSIESTLSWIPDAGEATSSIWSTGRASAPRRGLGCQLRTSLTHLSPPTSTPLTLIDQLPVGEVGPGVGRLLAPGGARRGGALSQTRSLWLPQTTASGNPHRTFSALHFPLPRTWVAHFRFRVGRVHFPPSAILEAFCRRFLAKFCLVMLAILSVHGLPTCCQPVLPKVHNRVCEPLLPAFCRPSFVYRINPFDRRRPRPSARTIDYPFGLSSPHLSAVVEPRLFTLPVQIKLLRMDPTSLDASMTSSQV
ncbi:hypothetical protein M9458_052926, partial [Cirrhinus mrigala]